MQGEACWLARELLEAGALAFGEFVLSSGLRSRVYVDLRRLLSRPGAVRRLAVELAGAVLALGADSVAGVATAGIPWATLAAYVLGLPAAYVRAERKRHGTSRLVEGSVAGRVVVVDDVATTGSSLAAAVEALRGEGASVAAALVVVDRCQGAYARLRSLGVELYALYTLPDLLACTRLPDAERALSELDPSSCSRNPYKRG